MNFVKALIPAAVLTWIVAAVIGRAGSRGGLLQIEHIMIAGHDMPWSWPLFIVATGLAWIIFWSLD